jgi:hypothetical protein
LTSNSRQTTYPLSDLSLIEPDASFTSMVCDLMSEE